LHVSFSLLVTPVRASTRLVAGSIAIVRAAACLPLSPARPARKRTKTGAGHADPNIHHKEHDMTTNPTRIDRIIALIDDCLAECGDPADRISLLASADGPTPRRNQR
jgi:hypothetical protein